MGADDRNETTPGPRGDAGIGPASGIRPASGIGPAALGGWFDAHGAALVLYARQWLDRQSAEDVVQEVFVRLMSQPGRQGPANVRAWLFHATRNAAIGTARSLWRRGRREREVARDHAEWFQPRPEDPIDARTAEAALQSLPAAQREIILLRLWSGMTLAEISEVTGAPLSTVHDHYRKGLAGVRRALESRSQPCTNRNPKARD
jgi:RNA polymerase sigma-70 factor (ECF subfamily)